MEMTQLGAEGPLVSRVGMGGCPLGGHGWGAVHEEEAVAAVHAALEAGVTFFDTADCYGLGRSEQLLGAALRPTRDSVFLSTKIGIRWDPDTGKTWRDSSPSYIERAVDASLRRLATDTLDLCHLHWWDGETPLTEAIGQLGRLRDAGKIRHIGLSNLSTPQIEMAARTAPIQALQLRASLIHPENLEDQARTARALGIGVVTWGSLGEGLLTGKFDADTTFGSDDRRSRYPEFQGEAFLANLALAERVRETGERLGKTSAQVAIRWLLDRPEVDACLFGAKNPSQSRDNAGAAGWTLTADEHRALLEQERDDDR